MFSITRIFSAAIVLVTGLLVISCQKTDQAATVSKDQWTIDKLRDRAAMQLDSSKYNNALFEQDIETYQQYAEVFNRFPLNKSPFPVAEYDYAVASTPFTIVSQHAIYKGVRIGAYENPESETILDKLTLIILTNDSTANENTLVESRNYPYLTAQGTFEVANNELDWVFSASPDGYAFVMINMKLFDLRFGETIIIYPRTDTSFVYEQLNDSPNHYQHFDDYKKQILNHPRLKHHALSGMSI